MLDAKSVLGKLPGWLAHYDDIHTYHALSCRLPRGFIVRLTQNVVFGF